MKRNSSRTGLKVIKLYDDWISLSKVFEEKEMEKVIR
jgi:hypothetical protein